MNCLAHKLTGKLTPWTTSHRKAPTPAGSGSEGSAGSSARCTALQSAHSGHGPLADLPARKWDRGTSPSSTTGSHAGAGGPGRSRPEAAVVCLAGVQQEHAQRQFQIHGEDAQQHLRVLEKLQPRQRRDMARILNRRKRRQQRGGVGTPFSPFPPVQNLNFFGCGRKSALDQPSSPGGPLAADPAVPFGQRASSPSMITAEAGSLLQAVEVKFLLIVAGFRRPGPFGPAVAVHVVDALVAAVAVEHEPRPTTLATRRRTPCMTSGLLRVISRAISIAPSRRLRCGSGSRRGSPAS